MNNTPEDTKMYRYRFNGGASRLVNPEYIRRLGTIRRIVAKRFKSTRSYYLTVVYKNGERIWEQLGTRGLCKDLRLAGVNLDDCEVKKEKRSYTTDYEVLMIYGDKGTARFSGCCWGYPGEGPRTVHKILLECGVPEQQADYYAFSVPRQQACGIDWEIQSNISWTGSSWIQRNVS